MTGESIKTILYVFNVIFAWWSQKFVVTIGNCDLVLCKKEDKKFYLNHGYTAVKNEIKPRLRQLRLVFAFPVTIQLSFSNSL